MGARKIILWDYTPIISHGREMSLTPQTACFDGFGFVPGDEARYSGPTFMCLAEDDLVGSQLSLGTPASLPCNKVLSNLLLLSSSLPAPQAQQLQVSTTRSSSWHSEHPDDKPEEKEEQPLPSLFDRGIPQPPKVRTDRR